MTDRSGTRKRRDYFWYAVVLLAVLSLPNLISGNYSSAWEAWLRVLLVLGVAGILLHRAIRWFIRRGRDGGKP